MLDHQPSGASAVSLLPPHVPPRALVALADQFIGLETRYPVVSGGPRPRIYLDSGAATLMWRPSYEFGRRFLDHYSNTHSTAHNAARISTEVVEWSRQAILRLLDADPSRYACFFTGSGSTAGFNRLARLLTDAAPGRPIALVSLLEHHSNDLPHRSLREVKHLPLLPGRGVDPDGLARALAEHQGQVCYASISAVSNVTGVINPVGELAEIAHRHDVPIIVDGAQAVAHLPLRLSAEGPAREPDAVVFSGHKLYTPGSPGVVVIKRELLGRAPVVEFGGGMVSDVYEDGYDLVADPVGRQEAGTLNIPGIAMLGATAHLLRQIGMATVQEHERALVKHAFDRLGRIRGVRLYGSTNLVQAPRAGSFAFNVQEMPHGLLAAILNDHFNIAVRNECFCAHPYVRDLLREDFVEMSVDAEDELEARVAVFRGMVRVSLGLYSRQSHIDEIADALTAICADRERFTRGYTFAQGGFVHPQRPPTSALFAPEPTLAALVSGLLGGREEGLA